MDLDLVNFCKAPRLECAREEDDLCSISDFERGYVRFYFLKKLWNIPVRELHTIVGVSSKEQFLAQSNHRKGKPCLRTK